jgi:5'-3' exonuclease
MAMVVNKKITEGSNWRDIHVVLSGHEVPGEGEHKRLLRAQPDRLSPTLSLRSAELIMLGPLSHDLFACGYLQDVSDQRPDEYGELGQIPSRNHQGRLQRHRSRFEVWPFRIMKIPLAVRVASHFAPRVISRKIQRSMHFM